MRKLVNQLKKTQYVQILNLSEAEFNYNDLRLLTDALSNNDISIRFLNLDSANCEDFGAKLIGFALEANTGLKKLDLNNNDIRNEGAEYISEAIRKNKTLKELDLQYNCIGDEGAKEIASALKKNSTLESLNFHFNDIGDLGAEYFALALISNTSLRKLDLSMHEDSRVWISDTGISALTAALKQNNTLEKLTVTLYFSDNFEEAPIINEDVADAFRQAYRAHMDRVKVPSQKTASGIDNLLCGVHLNLKIISAIDPRLMIAMMNNARQ